MSDEIATIYA